MAGSFHRLTPPTYSGALPSNYDFINNATAGTPAFADGQKVGGPNEGSYFVAFGEDATSANANRANKALAQNTDYLDDLFHRDIAVPVRTNDTGPITSPVDSITLIGPGIFLGMPGAALDDLFHITDQRDNDILGAEADDVCSVFEIEGGSIGSGFSTGNITAHIWPPIPVGSRFHLSYGVRANLATTRADSLTNFRIRFAAKMGFQTAQLFRDLHGNGLPYGAPWTSTIHDLSLGGLDERYRRATFAKTSEYPGFRYPVALDLEGSGAWFLRDGPGMTGYSATNVEGKNGWASGVGHGVEGIWIADVQDHLGSFLPAGARVGGLSAGFVALGTRRHTSLPFESARNLAPAFATFYAADKQLANPTLSAGDRNTLSQVYRTYLPAGTPVALQGRVATIQPPAFFAATLPDPFQSGSTLQTAIALGYDLLELKFQDGSTRSFVFEQHPSTILSPTSAGLCCLDGTPANFEFGTTATLVNWIRTTFGIFDGAPEFGEKVPQPVSSPSRLRGTIFAAPPALTNESGYEIAGTRHAQFFGRNTRFNEFALTWGGHDQGSQTYKTNGYLTADGSATVETLNAKKVISPVLEVVDVSATGSLAFRRGPTTQIQVGGSGPSPSALDLAQGDVIRIIDPAGNASRGVVVNLTISLSPVYSTSIVVVIERTKSTSYDPTTVTTFAPVSSGFTMKFEAAYGANLATWDSSITGTMYDVFEGRIFQNKIFWTNRRFPK